MINQKTTYYLGAGASFNALPLAANLQEDILEFLDFFNPYKGSSQGPTIKFSKELYERYLNTLKGIEAYPTVDTFARALHESKSRFEIQSLGELISLYFILKQFGLTRLLKDSGMKISTKHSEFLNGAFDKRYLSLLSKVYSDGQLNPNLSIISWNYDCQVEIAMSKYLRLNYYDIWSTINMYPNNGRANFIPTNKSHRIVKLNGSAGLWNSTHNSGINKLQDNIDIDVLIKHANANKNLSSTVAYAWDNSDLQKNAISIANNIMRETENLVIIGYSFPDFNWELDYTVFKNTSVKRIYVQVREADFPQIEYKLKDLVRPVVSIEHFPYLDEFYLPLHSRNFRLQYVEPMKRMRNL